MDSYFVRSASRLQAFADAIFSIVATVMILPIAHTEVADEADLDKLFEHEVIPQLLVYFGCFLVICNTWSEHVWLFQVVEKVDEFTVLCNIALMMVITFFPFTFTLLAKHLQNSLAVQLFCVTIILVCLIQAVYVLYAFRNPRLLAAHIQPNVQATRQRNQMLFSLSTPVFFATMAAIVSTFSVHLANVLLFSIVFGNWFRRSLLKLYQIGLRCIGHPELNIAVEELPLSSKLSFGISKERLECFSDGIFAIVATLMILDICEKNVPSSADAAAIGSLSKALAQYRAVFLAYAGTFTTVGLLWYVHHSLIHTVKTMNLLMTIFNNLCLMCIGVMPLAFRLVTIYDEPGHKILRNENLAIQFNCVVIFMAGLFQCIVWIIALFDQYKNLKRDAHYGTPEHYYITAKLLVCPMLSLVVYLVSLTPDLEIGTKAFNGLQMGCLGIFLLLQFFYKTVYTYCLSKDPIHIQEINYDNRQEII